MDGAATLLESAAPVRVLTQGTGSVAAVTLVPVAPKPGRRITGARHRFGKAGRHANAEAVAGTESHAGARADGRVIT